MIPFTAHGALGIWDEVIFASVAAVFMVMMGLSWVRSRSLEPDFEDDPMTDAEMQTPPTDEDQPGRFPIR